MNLNVINKKYCLIYYCTGRTHTNSIIRLRSYTIWFDLHFLLCYFSAVFFNIAIFSTIRSFRVESAMRKSGFVVARFYDELEPSNRRIRPFFTPSKVYDSIKFKFKFLLQTTEYTLFNKKKVLIYVKFVIQMSSMYTLVVMVARFRHYTRLHSKG